MTNSDIQSPIIRGRGYVRPPNGGVMRRTITDKVSWAMSAPLRDESARHLLVTLAVLAKADVGDAFTQVVMTLDALAEILGYGDCKSVKHYLRSLQAQHLVSVIHTVGRGSVVDIRWNMAGKCP